MKQIILTILLTFLISLTMSAQQSSAKIKQVNVKPLGNMVYIKWITTNNKSDCLYSIQKSVDGNKYETIGVKKGIVINNDSINLLYTFVDLNAKNDDSNFYKIFLIDKNGEIKDSKSIIVDSSQE